MLGTAGALFLLPELSRIVQPGAEALCHQCVRRYTVRQEANAALQKAAMGGDGGSCAESRLAVSVLTSARATEKYYFSFTLKFTDL